MFVRARAPGRVNLIGDHTDYTGGLALPLAIDLETVITGERRGPQVILHSAAEERPAVVELDGSLADDSPAWAAYVSGVVAELDLRCGLVGEVTSTVPPGSGLSSSAALEVAIARALLAGGHADALAPVDVALLCQRAEQKATGVPCGVMDQLASAAGIAGHGLLVDFSTLEVHAVPIPDDLDIVVIHSGESRRLAGSAYAERRARCEAAASAIGPLTDADLDDLRHIPDPTTAARARHVITENARVVAAATALVAGDAPTLGRLMVESHRSLAEDFAVSTPTLDALVDRLVATPGVHGARLTGAGFGGCVVAVCDPDVLDEGWRVRASAAASAETSDTPFPTD